MRNRARGIAHWNYKHGFRSGYTLWRYGTAPAPSKQPRIFKGEKREHALQRTLAIIRNWRSSPFEYEGAARAAIRSALCLQGYSWARSDHEAAALVAEALQMMGAERPSWAEGQPEYLIPPDHCRGCAGPLDEEQKASRIPFCSIECARNARQRWGFERRAKEDERYNEITEAILKLASPKRQCPQCKRQFRSHKTRAGGTAQVYCSADCANAAKETVAARECLNCGRMFKPVNNRNVGRYCSRECTHAGRKKLEISRTCVCCGTEFTAPSKGALYCSMTCASIVSRFRTGRNTPKRLSPPVFDYVFKEAA